MSVDEVTLSGLSSLIRAGTDDTVSREVDVAGCERLVAAVTAKRGVPRQRWMVAALAAMTLAAAVFILGPRLGQPALEYAVSGAPLLDGGYVRAAGEAVTVRFSDGSELSLDAHSSGRVVAVTEDGAQLLLEQGRARVQVQHTDTSRWTLDAGPYQVTVTGTRFDVAWSPSEQQFELVLHEGSVRVRGPMSSEGVTLHAGQRLRASPLEGELHIVSSAATAPHDSAPSAATAAPADADAAGAGSATTASATAAAPQNTAAAAPRKSWGQMVAAGDAATVLAEAEARGIGAVLATSPVGDLVALSDAARYRGRGGVARQALLAIRKRFGGTEAAKTAAFLLGRMADGGGSRAAAVRWYDRYLAEAPAGSFAAEALGRKMVAVRASSGSTAAAPLARSYLKRYPRGPYAPLAKNILGR